MVRTTTIAGQAAPPMNGFDEGYRPQRQTLVKLLKEHFFNRTDRLCFMAPWGTPCPLEAGEKLDAILASHLLGAGAESVETRWKSKNKSGVAKGPFRVGTYSPTNDGLTRFAVIDADGGGDHSKPLADPLGAALEIVFTLQRVGVVCYLERSKSGKGWHVWVFFSAMVPAALIRKVLWAVLPKDLPLAGEGAADPTAGVGIEVFPKQDRAPDVGNQVFLPWWHGAEWPCNQFHRVAEGGEPEPYVPDRFDAVSEERLRQLAEEIDRRTSGKRAGVFTNKLRMNGSPERDLAFWVRWGLNRPKTRNPNGFDLACQLRDNEVSREDAKAIVRAYVKAAPSGDHPYTEDEALASLEQAYDRPARESWEESGHGNIRPPAASTVGTVGVSPDVRPSWPEPILLGKAPPVPPFPCDVLPPWLAGWVRVQAEATQTPPDLAGMLALAVAGAGLAGKLLAEVREGWLEPLNLFCIVALLTGERKSVVFRAALAPVVDFESSERNRMAEAIAKAQSDHRQMEARLKVLETKAAKAEDLGEQASFREQAHKVAKDLAAHKVPAVSRLWCDDVTPEKLANLLFEQDGRMLQAAPEGTLFEIAKGRYSEGGRGNFDVYLKGHPGDPLRIDRVSRPADVVDRPALSVALTVQPDVIVGLAGEATMRHRGFLARFLYSLPASRVGSREIAPRPVPSVVMSGYRDGMLKLWRLAQHDPPVRLGFSSGADLALRELEAWLEPQLAEGEGLSGLAGWANKLAGACARIAGILHMAGGGDADYPVSRDTVLAAVRLGRDYLLPHARAAFGVMAVDAKTERAHKVWTAVVRLVGERSERSEGGGSLSRRDLHQAVRRRSEFTKAEEIDPAIDLLVDRYLLRPVEKSGSPGKGHRSPEYLVNPKALALERGTPPSPHSQPSQPVSSP